MKNNNKFRLDVWGAITLVTIALYALFLLYPMAYLIRQSVMDPDTGGFTLAYFTKFFSKSYYFDTLINSFKVSITATVLSIAIGTPLAYLFTIFKIKGKGVLNILIVVASMSAPFIGAYSWILLLGRSGVITTFFKNLGIAIPDIYGFGGIVLVMTLQLFPLVFLYAKGALKNIDNSLIEAAENLGCSGIACFFKVVVPLIMPTLLAAALLVFMRSFADFGTPMLIGEGYRTFPVVLYTEFINEVGGSDGFAAAIAVIAIVITTLVFLVQKYVSNKNAFALNSMHPVEEREARKGINALVHLVGLPRGGHRHSCRRPTSSTPRSRTRRARSSWTATRCRATRPPSASWAAASRTPSSSPCWRWSSSCCWLSSSPIWWCAAATP